MKNILPEIVLWIFCVYCMVTDIKTRKIYNHATFPMMILGMIWHTFWGNGILFSLKGLGAGIGVLVVPFALRGIGAGDLKFVMGVGSVMGWIFCVWSFLISTIVHFIIVMIYLARRKDAVSTLSTLSTSISAGTFLEKNIDNAPKKDLLPYGVSFFLGIILARIGFYLKWIS